MGWPYGLDGKWEAYPFGCQQHAGDGHIFFNDYKTTSAPCSPSHPCVCPAHSPPAPSHLPADDSGTSEHFRDANDEGATDGAKVEAARAQSEAKDASLEIALPLRKSEERALERIILFIWPSAAAVWAPYGLRGGWRGGGFFGFATLAGALVLARLLLFLEATPHDHGRGRRQTVARKSALPWVYRWQMLHLLISGWWGAAGALERKSLREQERELSFSCSDSQVNNNKIEKKASRSYAPEATTHT